MKRNCFIGITGGIGSGKSTVSLLWSACAGLPLINIDQLCRELLEIEMPGWLALKATLGRSFFGQDGQLDRPGLRAALFADAELRQKVDQVMHPLALSLLHEKAADLEGPVLVDVPLLFEAGWDNYFRRIVVVYADRQTCCRRVTGRDKVVPEAAVKAIFSQMGIGDKALRADHVVDNSSCWLFTRMQVLHLAKVFMTSFNSE